MLIRIIHPPLIPDLCPLPKNSDLILICHSDLMIVCLVIV
jgi:hypothetical protein